MKALKFTIIASFVILIVIFALFLVTQKSKENNIVWHVVGNSSYLDEYNNHSEYASYDEMSFSGILEYKEGCGIPQGVATTLQRCNPYKLDGIDLHPVREDFFKDGGIAPGDNIEVVGKKVTFELEGRNLTEILVRKIRLLD